MELSDILGENIIFPKANYTSKEEVLNGLANLFKKERLTNYAFSYKVRLLSLFCV